MITRMAGRLMHFENVPRGALYFQRKGPTTTLHMKAALKPDFSGEIEVGISFTENFIGILGRTATNAPVLLIEDAELRSSLDATDWTIAPDSAPVAGDLLMTDERSMLCIAHGQNPHNRTCLDLATGAVGNFLKDWYATTHRWSIVVPVDGSPHPIFSRG